MAKSIEIVGANRKKIEVVDRPKRRIEPVELAASLGANLASGQTAGNLDLIALGELGTQLLGRLRSRGGRPALTDATEICRVPLSTEDLQSLEKITDHIAQTTGSKPSPGQVISVIVHDYLKTGAVRDPGMKQGASAAEDFADWLPRLAEITSNAAALHKTATAIAAAAKDIEEKIAKAAQ
jgi:hypothetical protein